MSARQSIVIVGGGFAGTTLARKLDGRLPANPELVLISEESYTTFHPMLPEALGASVFPEQVVAPIRQMLTHGRFIMGRVSAIDPARRTLACSTLAGEVTVGYAHLASASIVAAVADRRSSELTRVSRAISDSDSPSAWLTHFLPPFPTRHPAPLMDLLSMHRSFCDLPHS